MTILPTVLGLVAGVCLYVGVFHLLVGWPGLMQSHRS
jgi:hypothetical protein